MSRLLFLPGAGGRLDFWAPVASRLSTSRETLLLGWPGFGDDPPDPCVTSLTGLVDFVLDRLDGPVDLVAQSMGGVVATLLTLRRPDLVRSLVLCGTSGGIDLSAFETEDWRPDYLSNLPETAPRWFVDDSTDVEARLLEIHQPVLLIWGEADTVVPLAAGRRFAELLPNARLVTLPGGSHAVAQEQPDLVAQHIATFLGLEALSR
ncbi:MAG TPA: alpha/beta hydrolase [Dehalococcoidia bacterium]|nr:alpha/beta hydrolase [Dehalococcoidia bacterium]